MPIRAPFSKIRPGDPLALYAAEINALLDLLRPQPEGKPLMQTPTSAVDINVKNTTSNDLPRFSILTVDTPTFDYSAASERFKYLDLMQGSTPTASSNYVVTQVPIRAGSIGKARLVGMTRCKLNVAASGDTHADVGTSTDELDTGTSGTAKILWKDSGTGSGIWAVVNLLGQSASSSILIDTASESFTISTTSQTWSNILTTGVAGDYLVHLNAHCVLVSPSTLQISLTGGGGTWDPTSITIGALGTPLLSGTYYLSGATASTNISASGTSGVNVGGGGGSLEAFLVKV